MTFKLKTQERQTLQLVGQAVFTNPFSSERAELDLRIAAGQVGRHEKPIEGAVAELHKLLEVMEEQGRARRENYGGEDRKLIENFQLFLVFHEFVEELDQLIRRQESSDRPVPVPFADRILGRLTNAGFNDAEAERYLGVFFQMRRAFYFINHSLIGTSASMIALRCQLWNNVFTHDMGLYNRWFWNRMEDFSTLLIGETGTGKGTAAAAIGRSAFIPFDAGAGRFKESFVNAFLAVNLTQYPETLLEAELFGYRKGAFTGAVEAHTGLLARCNAFGAIFLDEVGDVSVNVQVKLLKVLEERSFTPVGSHEAMRFRGRIVAATNQDLSALRGSGSFRDDLFYRLSSDVIPIPPLRQRIAEDPGELELLLQHLVERIAGEPSSTLVKLCMQRLRTDVGPGYPWPGNVRELAQAVRRIVLTQGYRPERAKRDDDAVTAPFLEGNLNVTALLGRYASMLYQRHGSYVQVARIMELDRRTVKRYIDMEQYRQANDE